MIAYGLAGLLFVGSSWIPTWIIRFTAGTMIGSAALLLLVLFAVRIDFGIGIAAFMAVAALFLEQRRRLIARIQGKMTSGKTVETPATLRESAQPASDLIEGEHHPEEERGREEDHGYKPSEERGDDSSAEDIGSDKHPLQTAGQDTEHIADLLESKGYAAP